MPTDPKNPSATSTINGSDAPPRAANLALPKNPGKKKR